MNNDKETNQYAFRIDSTADGFKFDYVKERFKNVQETMRLMMNYWFLVEMITGQHVLEHYDPKKRLSWFERNFNYNSGVERIDYVLTDSNYHEELIYKHKCFNVFNYCHGLTSVRYDIFFNNEMLNTKIEVFKLMFPEEKFSQHRHLALNAKEQYNILIYKKPFEDIRNLIHRVDTASSLFSDKVYVSDEEAYLIKMVDNFQYSAGEIDSLMNDIISLTDCSFKKQTF